MHFLSAVQVPLSATIVRGGTSSVPEMVLSSVHPPASSHEHESSVQRRPGRAAVPVGASRGVEPAYQRWGAEQGAGSASWGATAVFSSDWSGGQSPRGGLLVSVSCAIGKINTVKSACVVSVLFLKSSSILRQRGFSFPLFKLQLFQSSAQVTKGRGCVAAWLS